jgi:glucose-6-phosphate isomerase
MKITKNIFFKNYKLKIKKNNTLKLKKELKQIIDKKNKFELINSLSNDYKLSFTKKEIFNKYTNNHPVLLIGMGGSILGSKAIYSFLDHKIKKKFYFIDNLSERNKKTIPKKKINIIISKSGNTIETIINTNSYLEKNNKNIFITENKNNLLNKIAKKLKSEVIEHNNYIGGRYSVLSEVGMLPACMMGLDIKKFKQLNNLIKNKKFLSNLIINVSHLFNLIQSKKRNSIMINYDEKLDDFLKWYQQLTAESLGKNNKGVFPIISHMPKDNHSLLQLYLDGPKDSFFTFFNTSDQKFFESSKSMKFNFNKFLSNNKISRILDFKKKASENIFLKKRINFRSFTVLRRNEEAIGELFCFFILETILLGKLMKINPYDQPAVELVKKETKKLLRI